MKKILLLCSIAFMFACSNETETNSTQENVNVENPTTTAAKPLPVIENATDQMFYDYVTSDIYLEIVNSLKEFQSLGNLPNNIDFETSTQILTWIESHLDLTDFQSIEDARTRWQQIVELQQTERSQFSNIYEFIVSEDEAVVVGALDKWVTQTLTDPPKVVPSTNCDKNFDNCTNSANIAYYYMSLSQSNNADGMTAAKNKQMTELDKCSDAYIACINK